MQLKAVVLPDPFGPINPRISPSRTSNETRLSAMNPPNRFVRSEIVSMRDRRGSWNATPSDMAASAREVRRRRGKKDGRIRHAGDDGRIDVLELAVDDLEDRR